MKVLGLPSPGVLPHVSLTVVLRGGMLALVFVYAFFPVLVGLVQEWWSHSEYSFAFLVPGLAAYMLWRRRRELRGPSQPSVTGLALFVVGLTIVFVGYVVAEELIQRVAIPVTLLGLVYFLRGWRGAKACLLPIGYLVLMIPIPFPVYKTMALGLRLLDAKAAAWWAEFFGVPVLQEGYLLHLPRITLEVADGCSGTLSLLALVALGTFYISEKDMAATRKAVLWAALIPVSVLANIVRIVLIVVLVHYSGNWILDTTFHAMVGTVNFVLGFGVILLLGSWLDRPSSTRGGQA